MPQSKDKHRKIYTSTDAGHTTLGPNYGHEIEMYTVEQGEKRDKRQ